MAPFRFGLEPKLIRLDAEVQDARKRYAAAREARHESELQERRNQEAIERSKSNLQETLTWIRSGSAEVGVHDLNALLRSEAYLRDEIDELELRAARLRGETEQRMLREQLLLEARNRVEARLSALERLREEKLREHELAQEQEEEDEREEQGEQRWLQRNFGNEGRGHV
jgi:hypothetical protein